MWSRFTSKLYVRIWLAVVATVVVLTFAAAGVWHATREPRVCRSAKYWCTTKPAK